MHSQIEIKMKYVLVEYFIFYHQLKFIPIKTFSAVEYKLSKWQAVF